MLTTQLVEKHILLFLLAFAFCCMVPSSARSQYVQKGIKLAGIDSAGIGQKKYSITEIGIMNPTGINDSGQVSGSHVIGTKTVAVRWEKGLFKDFQTFEGASVATGINKFGVMSGTYNNLSGSHAVIFKNDSMIILPDPKNVYSSAEAINDLGHVAGQVKFCDTCRNAAVWKGGDPINLGSFSKFGSYANDMNNSGLVVGDGEAPPTFNDNAFKTTGGGLINLGTLGGSSALAKAVNNLGHIAGSARDASGKGHAVIWNPGILDIQNPGTFNGEAYDINDSDVVVGNSGSIAFVWKDGFMQDLNTLCDTAGGWVLQRAVAINNLGQIVGTGLHKGVTHAFLLNLLSGEPPTSLTYNQYIHSLDWKNPKSKPNKLIIAKKTRFTPDAQWEVIGDDSMGVLLVTDSSWTIRTSGYNEYKAGAIFSSGDTMYSNSVNVPRGYYLRKIEGDSVSAYNIFAHSFRKISNSSADIWPIDYWKQFDYKNPVLYDQMYFSNAESDVFPNWLLAAEVEGFGTSFISYPDKVNPGAVTGWKFHSRSHKGSCLGFSTASIFDFYREPALYDKFHFFESLLPADVLASDSVIHMISYLQSYQIFGKHNNFIPTSNDPTPKRAVHELEQYFQNYNNKFYAYLSIGEAEMCHAIVPYAIEKVNDDLYYIYVYDSNKPALNDLRIEVQMNSNKWRHSYFTKNKFISGKISVKTGIENILLPNTNALIAQNLQKSKVQNTVRVTMGSDASSFVIQNGDTISGFNALDSTVINSAIATILETDGILRAPAFYNLPAGDYSILIKDYGVSKEGASLLVDNGKGNYLGVQRSDSASPADRDIVIVNDNALSFVNPDPVVKKLTFHQFVEKSQAPNNGKYFEASNVKIASSDSIRIATTINDNISFVNYGSASTFDLLYSYSDSVSSGTFKNTGVALPANSALTIITDRKDLNNSKLTILIDTGNNGTIDDSVSLKNQVLQIRNEHGLSLIPDKLYLEQNYPNPFNPSTVIGYQLPVSSNVSLKVYDAIGREVAVLVNEVKNAGWHTVTFNGSKLSSGIYFAKLHVGDKVQLKKMMLLK